MTGLLRWPHTGIVTLGFNVLSYTVFKHVCVVVSRLIFFFQLYHNQIHCLLDQKLYYDGLWVTAVVRYAPFFQSHKNGNFAGFAQGFKFHSHVGAKEIPLLSHTRTSVCMYFGSLTFFDLWLSKLYSQ